MKQLFLSLSLVVLLFSCGDKSKPVGKEGVLLVYGVSLNATLTDISPYNQLEQWRTLKRANYVVDKFGHVVDSIVLKTPEIDTFYKVPDVGYCDTTIKPEVWYTDSASAPVKVKVIKGIAFFPIDKKYVRNTWDIGLDSAIKYLKPLIKQKPQN